jgi:uncharacterized repeat protein (TIGR01451 family)
MRISRLLLTATLLAMLGSFSAAVQAAGDAVKVTSVAQVETEIVGKDGQKMLKRGPVQKAVPGTEVIYTTTFENLIKKPVGNIVINNPVPNDSEYKAGSAFGRDCDIQFSADGGKTFGHAEELKVKDADGKSRPALAKEYTNIRWIYKKQLAPGKSGEVGFRAAIK